MFKLAVPQVPCRSAAAATILHSCSAPSAPPKRQCRSSNIAEQCVMDMHCIEGSLHLPSDAASVDFRALRNLPHMRVPLTSPLLAVQGHRPGCCCRPDAAQPHGQLITAHSTLFCLPQRQTLGPHRTCYQPSSVVDLSAAISSLCTQELLAPARVLAWAPDSPCITGSAASPLRWSQASQLRSHTWKTPHLCMADPAHSVTKRLHQRSGPRTARASGEHCGAVCCNWGGHTAAGPLQVVDCYLLQSQGHHAGSGIAHMLPERLLSLCTSSIDKRKGCVVPGMAKRSIPGRLAW